MEISGAIQRVQYFNKAGGYTVALFHLTLESFQNHQNTLSKRVITVLGNFDREPQKNEEYELSGEFFHDKQYGLEFKFVKFRRTEIKNEDSLINYLSSDLFEGIGLKTATKIIKKLGTDTISKITNDEHALEGIGLTRKQIEVIQNGIHKDNANQEAILFYLSNGLTIDIASKIINTLGEGSIQVVKENPYILMDKLERFGFKKNDAFALNMGLAKNSQIRLEALVSYILKEMIYNNGNSYIYFSELFNQISQYLNIEQTLFDSNQFLEVLKKLANSKKIFLIKGEFQKDYLIFDYILYYQETTIAKEIVALLKGTRGKVQSFSKEMIESSFLTIKNKKKINFSSKQKEAILSAFTQNFMVITGGPGTGKTTIVKTILELYQQLLPDKKDTSKNIALLAPTGRAAKRLQETTGLAASTIHRYLGFDGTRFAYNKDEPRSEELVIVDEASMMDLPLMYQLITSISTSARFIIVGDVDQLPSIGPGQILKDIIDTREVLVIKLDQIHRQEKNSSIITLAHDINEGTVPFSILEKKQDRSFIETNNDLMIKNLLDIVKISISKGYDIQKDIQILIPMYKSEVGINNVNSHIQELINPKRENVQEFNQRGKIFRINDKIIQLVNRPEKGIMNGDIGYIESFNILDDEINGIIAMFDGNRVEYSLEDLEDINLAYAITIHKAQGSEFPIVILPISSLHYVMLKRKLLYTGITRAKQKLILLGDVKMLKVGVSQVEKNRKTILKDEIISLIHDDNINKPESKHLLTEDTEPFKYDIPLDSENELDITSIGEEEFTDFDLDD